MQIGVFFGSRSPEHDISIITAELIIAGLKKLGYTPIPVYLGKNGEWYIGGNLDSIETFKKGQLQNKLKKYSLDLEESKDKIVFRAKGLVGKKVEIDLAFPAFHGTNGEDGVGQGFFEIFNVPYVGCDLRSSAVAMDKVLTKSWCSAHSIPTTKYEHFSSSDWSKDREKVLTNLKQKLKYPMFVKPPLLGSSIGISKVADEKELEFGIEVALHYGNTVLVEEGVENLIDITCCVMGHEDPVASLLQESIYSSSLLSYEDKYIGGTQTGKSSSKVLIPARLDKKTTEEIRNLSMQIFKQLGCSGIARFDFLVDSKTGSFFVNEINPLPGTLYHHLWAKSGVTLSELLKNLIEYARVKHQQKQNITSTFKSDILKMTGGKFGSKKLEGND